MSLMPSTALAEKKGPGRDLRDFIQVLERAGELVRVREEVDPYLEISEITDRVSKASGPALLFEHPKAGAIPVLINAFGSYKRMALALGVQSIEEVAGEIRDLLELGVRDLSLKEKFEVAGKMFELSRIRPRLVRAAPCQERVFKDDEADLSMLPILTTWPKDAGPYITFPLVITRDPETGKRNVGVYRMQVLSRNSTAMHWQTQKDGATHSRKAGKGRLEVAAVIGADPATVFSGVAPLPYGMDEFLLSGFLNKRGVELVRCRTVDLEVPASSEIVIEGYVDPSETVPEGPFGDHTGVYTPPELFPVFHVTCMTMRQNPIYLTTIVGKPPMEDFYIGKTIERIFLPLIKKQLPEVHDMNFPLEGTFNNAVIVSIDKQFPFQARKTAHAIWGLGQLCFTKVVIIVERHVDVHDLSRVALEVFNNIDPERDVFFVQGPVDTLNHASPLRDFGSKMGIDATNKWKEEGYTRVWPEEITMDEETKRRVTEKWEKYGIS